VNQENGQNAEKEHESNFEYHYRSRQTTELNLYELTFVFLYPTISRILFILIKTHKARFSHSAYIRQTDDVAEILPVLMFGLGQF
jgi:hypothetical protein